MKFLLIAIVAVLVVAASYTFFRKKSPEDLLAVFQKEMEPKGGTVFQTMLEGKNTAFLLLNCEVFLLDVADGKVKREKVLKPGFYLGFTACTDQSISAEGGYALANLANRAIGAGGGNTSGGAYRSKDGRVWEKKTSKGWRPVDEAQN